MLPHQCPSNQIHLQQVGQTWKVVQRDIPIEDFDTLREALNHTVEQVRAMIKAGRNDPVAIIVTPPASPWMRE